MNVPEREARGVFGGAPVTAVELLGRSVPAATDGVWRVEAGGDAAILKVIRHDPEGNERWPSSEVESHPYSWRREALAYGSGLLEGIAPLRAPRCLLDVEREDGSIALWLEDAGAHPVWTIQRLAGIARELGLMQGRLAARSPTHRWLSRGWLRAYLDLRARWIEPYREGPFAMEVQRIWERRDEILAAVDAAPRTLCHFDFYPANIFGEDETVVIDWAYCRPRGDRPRRRQPRARCDLRRLRDRGAGTGAERRRLERIRRRSRGERPVVRRALAPLRVPRGDGAQVRVDPGDSRRPWPGRHPRCALAGGVPAPRGLGRRVLPLRSQL